MKDTNITASKTARIQETPAQPPSRPVRSKRRILLLGLGLVVLIFGTLYSWLTLPNNDRQGKEAYQARNYDAAIAQYSVAIEANPKDAQAYLGRSWAYLGKGQWQQALRDSTEALRLSPHSALALTAQANALEGLNQVPEAIKALDEAIRNDPRCAKAYYERARIGYEHNLKGNKPLADVEKAIQLDPKLAAAYSLEAMIQYLENKDYAKSIQLCDKALKLDPYDAPAYLVRGYALINQGENKKGTADVDYALRINPKLKKAVNVFQPKEQGK